MSKEKQIEEMARTLCGEKEHSCKECDSFDLCEFWLEASTLYNAGYRKQSEGEWKWISDDDCICSACGKVFYSADNADAGTGLWKFCPNCGAKMKGGAE